MLREIALVGLLMCSTLVLAQSTFTVNGAPAPFAASVPYGSESVVIAMERVGGSPLTPLTVTVQVTAGNCIIPQATTAPRTSYVATLQFGDLEFSFTVAVLPDASATPCTVAYTTTDGSTNVVLGTFTPALRNIQVHPAGAVTLRAGQSISYVVRVAEGLPVVGTAVTIQASPSGNVLLSPTQLAIPVGETSVSFTVTAQNTFVNTTASISVSALGDIRYTATPIALTINAPLPLVERPSQLLGTIRLPPAIQSAPWYVFVDTTAPILAGSSFAVGGSDSVITPRTWNFNDAGVQNYQRFTLLNNFPGQQPLAAQGGIPLNFGSFPAVFGNTFQWISTVNSAIRPITFVNPTTVSPRDQFHLGAQLRQPIPQGMFLDVHIDSNVLEFQVNAEWKSGATFRITAGQSGATFRARVRHSVLDTGATLGGLSPTFWWSYSGTAGFLFGATAAQAVGLTLAPGSISVTAPTASMYLGAESHSFRVNIPFAPQSSTLRVIPFNPHCAATPSVLTFVPGGALHQRFTLRCSSTFDDGSGVNPVVSFYLGGQERYWYAKPADFPLSMGRAPVQIFTGSPAPTALLLNHQYSFSVYTNRAPSADSPITVSFVSTQGLDVTPDTVTLTADAPGTSITVVATSLATPNAVIQPVISGADAHFYLTSTPVSLPVASRAVNIIRVCTPAELAVIGSCSSSSSNFTLNQSDRFLTFFNVSLDVPPVERLVLVPSNKNLKFIPEQITIDNTMKSATFAIGSSVAGNHEVFFSFAEPSTIDSLSHNLPAMITVTQTATGVPPVSFPTSSAVSISSSSLMVISAVVFAVVALL